MKKLSLAAIVGALGAAGLVALGQTNAIAQAEVDPALFAALMSEGGPLYAQNCAACHGAEGQGGPSAPRLAPGPAGANPFLASGMSLAYQIIVGDPGHGMPPFGFLNDRQVAAISTFVRNSWGNDIGIVLEATAALARADAEGGGDE